MGLASGPIDFFADVLGAPDKLQGGANRIHWFSFVTIL
jgi:hypothetical protein